LTADFQFFKKRGCFFVFFCVVFFVLFFYSIATEGEVAVHPCEILLIGPAEASQAAILNRSTAIIALVYPAPDVILCLVGEVSGAVVARLLATVACADGLVHDVGNAARAGRASAGILLVTDADGLVGEAAVA
jgi:hypothetical protein